MDTTRSASDEIATDEASCETAKPRVVARGESEARPSDDGQPRFSARLLVRGQSEARRFIAEIAPTDVLSILTPGRSDLGPRDFPAEHRLTVSFEDTETAEAPNAPNAAMIDRILAFARAVPADGLLLVHGLQSVRRAPAVALGLLADRMAPAEAAQALTPLCSLAPDPCPFVVALFDERLGLDGALSKASATRFVPGRQTLLRRVPGDGRFLWSD